MRKKNIICLFFFSSSLLLSSALFFSVFSLTHALYHCPRPMKSTTPEEKKETLYFLICFLVLCEMNKRLPPLLKP